MNIVFAIKALGSQGGGAERVLVDVVSGLTRRGHRITIISSDPEGKESYYPVNDMIQRVNLGIGNIGGKSNLSDVVRRMINFRRAIAKINPDIVVAFMHSTYLPFGMALIGSRIPMIASEHIGPEHYRNRLLERALLLLTPLIASRVTVVSEQISLSFNWWLRRRMMVIPNPLSGSVRKRLPDFDLDSDRTKILLSVGRLAPQKNQQCLIAAFAEISSHFPNWKLRIVGEGELRRVLEKQVLDLGLADKVELPGAIADVSKEYACADIFVLPSTYESFGLTTAEALLHGLPAVGFADCPGTNKLIRHKENGILVSGPDKTLELASSLGELMANPDERKKLSNASTEELERMFNIDTVLDRWEGLISDVASNR